MPWRNAVSTAPVSRLLLPETAATPMDDPPALPRKYSLTIAGHRTSVTLEPPFWRALGTMARERGQSVSALVAEIDAGRPPRAGLASALRVAVLLWALAPKTEG